MEDTAVAQPIRDFALEVYFSRWEFTAKYNLGGSDAETLSQRALLDLASPADRLAYENLTLGYTETFGAPGLREEIAKTYDTVQPDHVLCFAGAEEAIYTAMKVLLSPDDHAIIVTPNYQAAETIPLSVCEVTGVPLDPDRDWELDVEQVRAAVRPNTKLISINFPNNPTGKIIPRATLQALVDICRRQGLWLFSDEVYRLIERDEALRLPQAVDIYERAISLNVMSKAYGLAGLRVGWLACKDRDTLVRLERFKHFLSICNSAPSEMLALIALRARAAILDRNRRIVRANVAEYARVLGDFRELFDWEVPDGGCVAFIRYKGKDGVEEFAHRVVSDEGVLFLPASLFRSDLSPVPTDRFRVGLGRSYVPQGLALLRNWLERNAP
jgi:aspartate/methionine/tyrosine aminotransferase